MSRMIKKPAYLGTGSQVAYREALAAAEGSYAERHTAARRAVGRDLVGMKVATVRVADMPFVVSSPDLSSLPRHVKPNGFFVLEHCDDSGAIFLRHPD